LYFREIYEESELKNTFFFRQLSAVAVNSGAPNTDDVIPQIASFPVTNRLLRSGYTRRGHWPKYPSDSGDQNCDKTGTQWYDQTTIFNSW
jgi:hypothetical protein